jgi:hypothetical protein
MPFTTVQELINRCKRQLMEDIDSDGVRWSNAEAVEWLNEFYQLACSRIPEQFTQSVVFICSAGTMQIIPADMLILVRVTRNLDGKKRAVRSVLMATLDQANPDWHSADAIDQAEVFCLDPALPRSFWIYPPVATGTRVELVGAFAPDPHTEDDYSEGVEVIRCPDVMVPAAVDYILSRCFGKDSEIAASAAREAAYLQTSLAKLAIVVESFRGGRK